MNQNTKGTHDTMIEASASATSGNFEDHIENLKDVINYLDDLVSTWKKDYDKLDQELSETKEELSLMEK